MAVDVIMPNLGVSMKEGRVLTWRFKEGDLIDQGDEVVEIETDKVNYQVEAPISGILAKIIAPTGSVAAVGQALAVMVEEGESPDVGERPEAPQTETAASSAPVAASPAEAPPEDQRVRITPIARKMAFDAGLDVSRIQGGGAYGRIMKADVEAALQAKPADAAPAGDRKIQLGSSMPMSRMREIISQRLTMSARDVPHVYFMSEADASEMVRFRKTFLDDRGIPLRRQAFLHGYHPPGRRQGRRSVSPLQCDAGRKHHTRQRIRQHRYGRFLG